ncbi:MAG: hypothetical protein H6647_06730 [Anaerolineales bacterium]|nr:hypothetical protein [Anaerolineales bacterium]
MAEAPAFTSRPEYSWLWGRRSCGETLPDASIEDVLPTMLYAGIAGFTSLEGQIIVDAFDPAVLAARSVIHDAEPDPDSTAGAPNYSADEAGQIANGWRR